MFVRFIGFNLEQDGAITLEKIISKLGEAEIGPEGADSGGRFVFTDSSANKNYFLGLIVTVKSQRKFCQLQGSGLDGFKVIVKGVDDDSSLMEFNFFVINKQSGTGLYQHYHQSCSINNALHIIKRYHSILLNEERNAEAERISHDSGIFIEKARAKASRLIRSSISHSIIVRKEALQDLLKEMKKIKALEIDFNCLVPAAAEFTSLKDKVRRQRERFAFFPSLSAASLVSPIQRALSASGVSSGRVFAVDENNVERIFRILQNPDNFGEFDYDYVASEINDLDVNSFQNSWVINALLKACEQNKHIFEAKIEN